MPGQPGHRVDLEIHPGDDEPTPFSFLTGRLSVEQVLCWITYTNQQVHDLIRSNLHCAPMHSGQIRTSGPRYCPSIEDKVVRFAEKDRHQLFLEPQGRRTMEIYMNGISTSLPREVGLVDETRWKRLEAKQTAISHARQLLDTHRCDGLTLTQWLRRPETTWETVAARLPELATVEPEMAEQVTYDVKYAGYVLRQHQAS